MIEPILPIFLLLSIFFSIFFSIATAADTLTSSHPLFDGQTLVSANGTFVLGFFTPPGTTNRYLGIWYNFDAHTVVWVANRQNPLTNLNGSLEIRSNGSLQIRSSGNAFPLWSSSPSSPISSPNPISQLLESGNLVVKEVGSRSVLWQSFDYPTDTLLSGMKLGPDLKRGIDRSLTAWRSASDPSPGNYTLALDIRGVPQVVIRSAGGWFWRGGPWNGFGFSGAGPNKFYDVALYRVFISGLNASGEEIYYYFNTVNNAISTLMMDRNGTVRRYEWQASTKMWNVDWLAPSGFCDFFPGCGINGICDSTSRPVCRCVDGFYPKNSVGWGRGDWSDGCVRAAALDCTNGTDEFVVVRGATLPDTSQATMDMSIDLDSCRARCLMNCSCKGYASADLSEGGNGCIVWMVEINDLRVYADGGQDFYVRVASGENGSGRKSWIFAVVAVAIVVFLLIILISVFLIRRWRGKKFYEEQLGNEILHKLEARKEGNSEISFFQFTQLVNATNNFSNFNKLGEGGFGPVYKGQLVDGQEVAIKRLSAKSGQGIEEFKNEILLIANLQHRNLVKLLGCCINAEEKMLIYEFMPNKSLDLLLFDIEEGTKLDWTRRFLIAEGVAQGLLYLHKHSRLRVIHRDLKASNILLDADMNPKISDFGMARIFDANEVFTRRIVGTYGYISPEYAFKGIFSVKSDVFSFGVLLLEIVSGKRNAGFHEFGSSCNLLAYAWDLWKDGNWMELVDPTLDNHQLRCDEVARCIYVALLCVQESPIDRPVMSDVVSMLGNDNLTFSIPKEPAFFTMKIDSDSRYPFTLHVNNSFNDLSVTIIAGR